MDQIASQTRPTKKIVVVGGGSAGWLTANVVAAEHFGGDLQVALVESPDVPTVGVGEGTWPSMRATLKRIGIAERDFLRASDASFKQGTRFHGWSGRAGVEAYTHPFSWPAEYADLNPARFWLAQKQRGPFAEAVTPQAHTIARGLAPKQAQTPEYAFAVNYGYHLDAVKFAALLRRNAVARLGVAHILGHVARIEPHPDGDVAALVLDGGERVEGDLFVDCTGARALLIGEHCGQRLVSVEDVLCNDRALVAQVPYADAERDPIASATLATAQAAGWIWDIGLQTRRGLGYVYASTHVGEDAALETLKRYVAETSPQIDAETLSYRTIAFQPGYRASFWERNCVAVGLSAGFVEPLEASALALIEQAAAFIAEQLPWDRRIMAVAAKRFNAKMQRHWRRIVEFLKLHYAVTSRDDSAYWRDHRDVATWPDALRDKLTVWEQQPPWHDDAPMLDELFPSASYQYVLYGMGFEPRYASLQRSCPLRQRAEAVFQETRQRARQMARGLPTNRDLLRALAQRTA